MKQLNLFNDPTPPSLHQQPKLKLTVEQLTHWKTRIFNHQQRILAEQPAQQTTLFDLAPIHCDPDRINPFNLQVYNPQFYRGKETGDRICIYFVIDQVLPILLYVGETKQSPKERWIGTHDCRRYIENYIGLHRQHQLEVQVNIAFWWDTAAERKARQSLELQLIKKWQSPFNKENWKWWGKPFG